MNIFGLECKSPKTKMSQNDITIANANMEAIVAQFKDIDISIKAVGNQVIACGVTFDDFDSFKNPQQWFRHLMGEHEIPLELSYHPKFANKTMAAVLKGGPKQSFEYFKKLMYSVHVVPYKDLLTKIAFTPSRICLPALKAVKKNYEILRVVEKDGLNNLLPIVAATGKTPQELKKLYGPTWKILSKNSLNKNVTLMKSVSTNPTKSWGNMPDKMVLDRAHLPTTVLKKYKGHNTNVMEHLAKNFKGRWDATGKHKMLGGELHTIVMNVNDTKRIASNLELPFNPHWTPRKMAEKHQEYVKLQNAEKYSDKPIEWLAKLPQKFHHEGYVATLLTSKKAVADEGSIMGHCVAGYADSVASGYYLVYSVVSKDGKNSSTLGISRTKEIKSDYFAFNQHYGRFNRRLSDQNEIDFASIIISELNKEKL